MDSHFFDRLTRLFAVARSRRALGSAVLGSVAALLGLGTVEAAPCPPNKKRCRGRCIPRRNCCTNANCRPAATGRVCRAGRCVCPASRPKRCNGVCIPSAQCCGAECTPTPGCSPLGGGCTQSGQCCGRLECSAANTCCVPPGDRTCQVSGDCCGGGAGACCGGFCCSAGTNCCNPTTQLCCHPTQEECCNGRCFTSRDSPHTPCGDSCCQKNRVCCDTPTGLSCRASCSP